jgi:sensor c-di-GMP phosphodiesterase-like protein
VAEGVESTEAWDLLREFGCDDAQGYLLSRPMPGSQFNIWLTRQEVRRFDRDDRVVPFARERRVSGADEA